MMWISMRCRWRNWEKQHRGRGVGQDEDGGDNSNALAYRPETTHYRAENDEMTMAMLVMMMSSSSIQQNGNENTFVMRWSASLKRQRAREDTNVNVQTLAANTQFVAEKTDSPSVRPNEREIGHHATDSDWGHEHRAQRHGLASISTRTGLFVSFYYIFRFIRLSRSWPPCVCALRRLICCVCSQCHTASCGSSIESHLNCWHCDFDTFFCYFHLHSCARRFLSRFSSATTIIIVLHMRHNHNASISFSIFVPFQQISLSS